jgi:hypothetical protein
MALGRIVFCAFKEHSFDKVYGNFKCMNSFINKAQEEMINVINARLPGIIGLIRLLRI